MALTSSGAGAGCMHKCGVELLHWRCITQQQQRAEAWRLCQGAEKEEWSDALTPQCIPVLLTHTAEHHSDQNSSEAWHRGPSQESLTVPMTGHAQGWRTQKGVHVLAGRCLTQRRPPLRDGTFWNYVDSLAA